MQRWVRGAARRNARADVPRQTKAAPVGTTNMSRHYTPRARARSLARARARARTRGASFAGSSRIRVKTGPFCTRAQRPKKRGGILRAADDDGGPEGATVRRERGEVGEVLTCDAERRRATRHLLPPPRPHAGLHAQRYFAGPGRSARAKAPTSEFRSNFRGKSQNSPDSFGRLPARNRWCEQTTGDPGTAPSFCHAPVQ